MTVLYLLKTLWNNKRIALIIGVIILILSFYSYYSYASNQISHYVLKTIELTKIIEEKDKLMIALKESYDKIVESKDALVKEISRTDKELTELKDKLFRENRNKKSLGELAAKKTSLVEKAINNATEKVFKCFEIISKNGDC